MAEALHELLAPSFNGALPSFEDPQTVNYLSRLSSLSLSDLTSTEPAALLYSSQSHSRNLQALSKRSRNAVISSSVELSHVATILPSITTQANALKEELPGLESAAAEFAKKYDRSTENEVLDRRKRAALLSRNVDRLADMLDLPSLLASTVSTAQGGSALSGSVTGGSTTYAPALDIQAHIKRLRSLYPQSGLVGSIHSQAEVEVQNLATILISSLQSPSLKLAPAMRTIGYLKRVAPELVDDESISNKFGNLSLNPLSLSAAAANNDRAIGALFLVCRLQTLQLTLGALEPLRDLADQETVQRQKQSKAPSQDGKQSRAAPNNLGSQSERFLKRYIEIFREQSFGILSMYKSIFPSDVPSIEADSTAQADASLDPLLPLPSNVSTFALQLMTMLEATLREYLPNVTDKASRESLLTQVLYCAGSLGRLGAEFGMMVALLDEDLREMDHALEAMNGVVAPIETTTSEPEWVSVMQKHRVQASRLEVLARGVGSGRKVSAELPTQAVPVSIS